MVNHGEMEPPETVPGHLWLSISYKDMAGEGIIGQSGNGLPDDVQTRWRRWISVGVKQPRLKETMHLEIIERFVEETK